MVKPRKLSPHQVFFAELLRELLDRRFPDLSLRARAAALGISAAYLSDLLNLKVPPPPPKTVSAFAEKLHVSKTALLRAARGENVSVEEALLPLSDFDFSSENSTAWRWCLSQIKKNYPFPNWKARFIEAIVLFFFTAETLTTFPDPDNARESLSQIAEKLRSAENIENFLETIFIDVLSCCVQVEYGRLLVFHALLFTEDFFSYLSSPSPLMFVYDEKRLAWVERFALKKMRTEE